LGGSLSSLVAVLMPAALELWNMISHDQDMADTAPAKLARFWVG
jgi:hypothetical protein